MDRNANHGGSPQRFLVDCLRKADHRVQKTIRRRTRTVAAISEQRIESRRLNLAGAHTFFVGNPGVGKMFFQQTPAIGTVLPLRMLVSTGGDGKAHVSYFDPKPLFQAVDPYVRVGSDTDS
jgi:Domain of unknown function DUF302